MIDDPAANPDEEMVLVHLDGTFDDLIDNLRLLGANVQKGLIVAGTFLPVAND